MSNDREQRGLRVCRSMYMCMEEIDRERAESGWNPYEGEEEPVTQNAQPLPQRIESEVEPLSQRSASGQNVQPLSQHMEPEAGQEVRQLSQNTEPEASPHAATRMTSAPMPANQMPQNMPLVYDETDWSEAADGQNLPQNDAKKDDRTEITRPKNEMPDSGSRPAWLPQESLNTGTEQATPDTVPRFQMPDREAGMRQEQEFERDLQRLQSLYPESAILLLPYIEEECEKMEYEGSQMYLIYPDREILNQIVARIYEAVREQFPPAEEPKRDEMLSMQSCESCQKPGEDWAEDMIRLMLLQEMHRRRCRKARCGRGVL